MRAHVALCILAVTLLGCTIVSADEDRASVECERAIPLPPWRSSYRISCKYLCKGWPMRRGNEPDGVPCGVTAAISTNKVCQAGHCVEAPSPNSTA